jgi:uncharacterized protein YraI
MRRATPLSFLAACVCAVMLLAAPAQAASRSTAHASGDVPVRAGPGTGYAVVGTLPKGVDVRLQRCTRDSGWCLVLAGNGKPAGWVRGSYLVGSAAKLEVTPHRFLEFDPLDPLGFCDDNDDWDDSSAFCDR